MSEATIHHQHDAVGVLQPCRCGHPAGKPIKIGDQVLSHLCDECWEAALDGFERLKKMEQAMRDAGVHERIISRRMLAEVA